MVKILPDCSKTLNTMKVSFKMLWFLNYRHLYIARLGDLMSILNVTLMEIILSKIQKCVLKKIFRNVKNKILLI